MYSDRPLDRLRPAILPAMAAPLGWNIPTPTAPPTSASRTQANAPACGRWNRPGVVSRLMPTAAQRTPVTMILRRP